MKVKRSSENLSIGKSEFLEAASGGRVPTVSVEVPYSDPAAVYPLFGGTPGFMLESVKGPPKTARYSFIGFEPYAVFKAKDGVSEISGACGTESSNVHPLRVLKKLLRAYTQEPDAGLPPFQGGAAGLLSYDFVHYLEKLPSTTRDDLGIPDAHFMMIDRLVAFDHLQKKAWAIICPGARSMWEKGNADWAASYEEAEAEAARIHKRIAKGGTVVQAPGEPRGGRGMEIHHETGEEEYKRMVRRVKEYIAAGDIFQANISLRVSAPVEGIPPWEIYTVLRAINPSPFAGYLDFGEYQIVSSSPERLVMQRQGMLETRPIAGTRPRGASTSEDTRLRRELLLNEKERAEHIMLIDLERNDLGRVCDYGSVEVDELMTTEEYSHVIHIVSNIKGRPHEGRTCLDAIRATFPGGTITGVPKIRCMQIIDELEPTRRGPYTGSFGYMGFSGDMDLNIVIRTFTIKGGSAYVQAGAGIVADSDPKREYTESLNKAEALIKTLRHVGGR